MTASTVVEIGSEATLAATRSPGFIRRLLRRKLATACVMYLLLVIVVAIVAPLVMPHVATEQAGDLFATRQGPSWAHPLGTDTLGRDVLDRLLVGTRVTMIGVGEALIVVLLFGVPLGLAAGFLGGWTDRVLGWFVDLSFAMPAIIILLVVLAIFPQSMLAGMVAFGVLAAPGLIRVVRSATLPVREELYIAAARVSGLSRRYILSRHVLPRVSGAIIVQSALLAAVALLVQTGLSFLKLLVGEPAPSWGGMVADGVNVMVLQPWLIWPPGIAIAVTILALGLLGDSARDAATESWSGAPRTRTPSRPLVASPIERSLTPSGLPSLLSVEDLCVSFSASAGTVAVVENASFEIRSGETVGIVGESGCGKTATAMSIMGLLPGSGRIESGRIRFNGQDLALLSEHKLRKLRGSEIGLVLQEPMVSLNPAFKVGWQLGEVVRRHHALSRSEVRARVLSLLAQVHLPDPETVEGRYPHELSGGMAQRVAIARALAGEPKLLIADEPTTSLDVTVQAEILDLLRELQHRREMAILLITHDWGVVADICDRAVVMYAGHVVESATTDALFRSPLHPYTQGLLASNPHNQVNADVLPAIQGTVPDPGSWPAGCHFHPRCSYATGACRTRPIPLFAPDPGRETRCIHYERLRVTT